MDGLEDKLSSFLSDPSAMEQILTMARALGLGDSASSQPRAPDAQPPQPAHPTEPDDRSTGAPLDDPMIRSIVGIMAEAGRDSGRQAAVFDALRPFVRSDRREKIDRAAQIARLAHIAGTALKAWQRNEKGRWSMYTRYIRGADGIYRRQLADDTPPQPQERPEPAPQERHEQRRDRPDQQHGPNPAPPQPPAHSGPEQKPPGGALSVLFSRQFAADDLLLAAIVLLLLIDGGEEDWIAILAALAFLLF